MDKQIEPKPLTNAKLEDLERNKLSSEGQLMTSDTGVKVNDDHNSLRAGERGPSLLEDFLMRDKMMHFDRERIPERVVHARGSGAHGVFKLYKSLAQYTRAAFLNDAEIETPVFVRFSTVAGFRGSADLARDVRGFAVKFYTTEGNFDLVGNNIPVFFIQDAMKFPDLVHAVKPEADNEMPQAASAHDTFWDFVSLSPETTHMIMWVMSDRAIPRSFRMMEGFGVHTFRLVNAEGVSHFVKFHWKPLLGIHSVAWNEAQKIAGMDCDFHRRDLWEAIESGAYPEWELGLQILTEEEAEKLSFDVLDPTKLIPEELAPVQRVGKMTLNRNPDNFFAETEQAAFHPGNIVPGIDFSDDPLLQGRLFSYTDTHLSRLGSPNFVELPINRPLDPVHNGHRDGRMRTTINKGKATYSPNSLGGGSPMQVKAADGGFVTHAERIQAAKTRTRSRTFMDHFSHAKLFYRSLAAYEQQHLKDAISFELSKLETPAIRERMVNNLTNVDMGLASYVAGKLGLPAPDKVHVFENHIIPADGDPAHYASIIQEPPVAKSPALSMANTRKDTIKTRQIAILIADGVDEDALNKIKGELMANGAKPVLIGPKLDKVKGSKGTLITPDKTFFNTASVLFDAVYVPGGDAAAKALAGEADAVHFVDEAFRHCKAIGYEASAAPFMAETHLSRKADAKTAGVIANGDAAAFIKAVAQHRFWEREMERKVPA